VTELLSSFDAAKIVGISGQGIRAAAERGDVPVAFITAGGKRLFRREDVECFARMRQRRLEIVRRKSR
jgi:hypothetical protein